MYLARIEEHFSQKRRQGLILSPKDWQLAQKWRQQGIPLPVVLRGINRSFERADSGKQIRSLAYCKAEVKRLWQEYKQQRAGAALEGGSGQDTCSSYPSQMLELRACLQASLLLSHPPGVMEGLQQLQLRLQELFEQQLADDWQAVLRQITKNLICHLNWRWKPAAACRGTKAG